MLNIPVNAVTVKGFPRLYKKALDVRVRYDPNSDKDEFYIALEMLDGNVRYLIGNDDELKIMDTRQLLSFLRRFTKVEKFNLITGT